MAELNKNIINDLVSIVIPIYNAEQYLRRCLDSLIKQTYKDIEIIAVSDGSPDNSEQIVKEYEKIDSRVKLVIIEHSGTSAAVAAGVKAANGEYIAFVDPDDYVGKDFIANFMEEIGDCDALEMGHYIQYSSGITEAKSNIKLDKFYTDKDYNILQDDAKFNGHLIGVVRWTKFYKRSLLNKFIYVYGSLKLALFEDQYFLQLLLLYVEKYKVCSKVNSYYHCSNHDSVMRAVKSIEGYCTNVEKFRKADIILKDFSNEKVTMFDACVYMMAMKYMSQYVEQLNKKEAFKAIKQIVKNGDFQTSLLIMEHYYKSKFSRKRYIKFRIRCSFYRFKKVSLIYYIINRRLKKANV